MTALARVNSNISGVPADVVRDLANRAIWQWYAEHKDDVVFTKKVFFISVTLRVRDLRSLIERIAGPEQIR